jgi:hypothetical protein
MRGEEKQPSDLGFFERTTGFEPATPTLARALPTVQGQSADVHRARSKGV